MSRARCRGAGDATGTDTHRITASAPRSQAPRGTASWFAAHDFPLAGGFTPNVHEDGDTRDKSSRRDGKGGLKVAWTPARGGEYAVSYVGQRGQNGV